jgi:selenide,water dikinase
MALVTTADFITPPVNDPYRYGQIAAANAISDIYAMGGRPLTCINLLAFPSGKLPPEEMHGIVAGGLSKITEAGAVLAGGHTIEDDEPKYGLAVTGLVHPDRIWRNAGAQAGDVLVLTKPIGSGVLFNANIKGWVSPSALDECIETISTLNRTAAEVLADFEVHGATDVTGFGLAGHGMEMAQGSGVCLHIDLAAIPVMREAKEMYLRGVTTGVNPHNRRLVAKAARIDSPLPEKEVEIVYDPQTSGGLLAALPDAQGDAAIDALRRAGVSHAVLIGRVTAVENDIHLIFS